MRYLSDFLPGQIYKTGRKKLDAAAIKRFAQEFDPQPFHLDEAAAKNSMFGGLAASGWHTACLTMRLLVDSDFKAANGLIGAGFDELRWPKPVRPGDELRVEMEVLESRASKSRPEMGLVKFRMTTLNQKDEAVQVGVCNLVVPTKKRDG